MRRPSFFLYIGLICGFSVIVFINQVHYVNVEQTQALDKLQLQFDQGNSIFDHDVDARYSEDGKETDSKSGVRIFLLVTTTHANLETKARIVRDTWAKRADHVMFLSNQTDRAFPTLGIRVPHGRRHLTAKTMLGFKWVHDNHLDDADWFMKADDDSYVIMENLRYFLSGQNASAPVWFGHLFKDYGTAQGYYSGGAGYVLSKEALIRLNKEGTNHRFCRQDGGSEDREIGNCMNKLGVKTVNTTDAMGRSRFNCFQPEYHIRGWFPDWYYDKDANGAKKGVASLSQYAISFHYVLPEDMILMDLYLYHLRVFSKEDRRLKLNANNVNDLLNYTKWEEMRAKHKIALFKWRDAREKESKLKGRRRYMKSAKRLIDEKHRGIIRKSG